MDEQIDKEKIFKELAAFNAAAAIISNCKRSQDSGVRINPDFSSNFILNSRF